MHLAREVRHQVDRCVHQQQLDRHFADRRCRRFEHEVPKGAASAIRMQLGTKLADQPLGLGPSTGYRIGVEQPRDLGAFSEIGVLVARLIRGSA